MARAEGSPVKTLHDFRTLLEQLDPSASHPTAWILAQLEEVGESEPGPPVEAVGAGLPWTERIWACHADTRLSLAQVAEACGRGMSWVYHRTGPSADPEQRIPTRQFDGRVVVRASDLRAWLREQEVS